MKDFVATNFSEYFKFAKKMYSKLSEPQNCRKVAECLYIFFLTTPDAVEKYVEIMQLNSSDKYMHCYNIEILNLFYPELQMVNTKPLFKEN